MFICVSMVRVGGENELVVRESDAGVFNKQCIPVCSFDLRLFY